MALRTLLSFLPQCFPKNINFMRVQFISSNNITEGKSAISSSQPNDEITYGGERPLVPGGFRVISLPEE